MRVAWKAWQDQVQGSTQRVQAAQLLLSRILRRHLRAGWLGFSQNQKLQERLRWALRYSRASATESAWRQWKVAVHESRNWSSAVAHYDSMYAPMFMHHICCPREWMSQSQSFLKRACRQTNDLIGATLGKAMLWHK